MYNKYIILYIYIYVCALFYNIIQHTLISHHQITSSRWEMAAAVDNWMIWSLGIHGLGVKKYSAISLTSETSFYMFLLQFPSLKKHCYTMLHCYSWIPQVDKHHYRRPTQSALSFPGTTETPTPHKLPTRISQSDTNECDRHLSSVNETGGWSSHVVAVS